MAQDRSFSEVQEEVDEWISQFEEGYWSPFSNTMREITKGGPGKTNS